MAAQKQRRFVVGTLYSVTGPSKRTRQLEFIARMTIDDVEHLIFKPQRTISKTKPVRLQRATAKTR